MKRWIVPLAWLGLFLTCRVALAADQWMVGASVALTGEYARTGQEQLNGIRMWVEEQNAKGGLLGKKVTLIHYDDESKPDTGAKLYEKLISDDRVDLLLGPYSSGVTMAAAAVVEKHQFPMVSAGASADEIWSRQFKNTFGLYTPAATYMDLILAYAKSHGLTRVAVVYEGTTFPRSVAKGVVATSKALGLEVVLEEEYGKGNTDFSALIIKLKSKKPDLVVGGSYLPDSTALVRQAKEHRLQPKLFAFAVGPGLPDFGANLGTDAEGVMGNTQWEPTLDLPGVKEFSARYAQQFGHEPGYHAAGGYGAGEVLAAAVTKAGSTNKDQVRTALQGLDIVTAFGQFKVDATGKQVGKPGFAIQWQQGRRELVLPATIASKKPLFPFPDWDRR